MATGVPAQVTNPIPTSLPRNTIPGVPKMPGVNAPAVEPMPAGYTFTPAQWAGIDPTVRQAMIDRESRYKVNREEQLDRVTGKLRSELDQLKAAVLQRPEPQQNGKSGARGWEDLSDSEFDGLYRQAYERLEAARQNPDDEQAQAAAARVTPDILRELAREDARRVASRTTSSALSAHQAQEQSRGVQKAVRDSIVRDFGGEAGEGILQEGNPLFDRALVIYDQLVRMGGGQEHPSLTYAAFQQAASESGAGANAGSRSVSPVFQGGAGRDQAISNASAAAIQHQAGIAALRQQGDEYGAHRADLDRFLDGGDVTVGSMPHHLRRSIGLAE